MHIVYERQRGLRRIQQKAMGQQEEAEDLVQLAI